MTQLFHAFYSKTQSTIRNNLQKTKDFRNIPSTNIYKLYNSNKNVIVTSVYRVDDYPNVEDCDIRYRDAIYLGIVDLWISRGD